MEISGDYPAPIELSAATIRRGSVTLKIRSVFAAKKNSPYLCPPSIWSLYWLKETNPTPQSNCHYRKKAQKIRASDQYNETKVMHFYSSY
jgi:hypothetical protein